MKPAAAKLKEVIKTNQELKEKLLDQEEEMDTLKEKGDGYLAELIVEVDDLDRFYADLQLQGIQLLDIDGNPFSGSEKGSVLEPYGDRIAYLPEDVSCGMTIEVCQRGPRETSLLHLRDGAWRSAS